ncbi:54S ribosomal protein L6 mitochondrial [Rhizina undulata]
MFPALRQSCLRPAPKFQAARTFAVSAACNSKIGLAPVSIPPSVELETVVPAKRNGNARIQPLRTLSIKGPLGHLSLTLPEYLTLTIDEPSKKATVSIADRTIRAQREMWGTTRALLQNHILGVSEGHTAILRLDGVGYRATIESGGKIVSLKVGYSHPIELPVPEGVKATTPQPTRILLEGCNKEVVKQFAADIRKWRVPEPYKGKGIFVNNETIKLKAKKIK